MKKQLNLTHKITLILGITGLTSCQTIEPQRITELKNVTDKQDELINAVLAERESDPIKTEIAKSATLSKAETHLRAALSELQRSSQTVKGALNDGKHQ